MHGYMGKNHFTDRICFLVELKGFIFCFVVVVVVVVALFVFNSWPKKQHSLYKKSAEIVTIKKNDILGFISFEKAFSHT
jgi:hypothetical protein